MGMPESTAPWTREMVLALPEDGKRYELFDGALLVTPAPTYVLKEGQLAQPDLFVLPPWLGGAPKRWEEVPNPILVIEVLSPATARYDKVVKRHKYQRAGIPEYWIVDPDSRAVDRWRPTDDRPEVLDESIEWRPRLDVQALVIELPEFFREVWKE